MPLARFFSVPTRRVATGFVLAIAPCLALAVAAAPRPAAAACINGDPLDCNPVGSTLDVAGRFVDPSPPLGSTQCAGFTNTAADDVLWNWENNCLPFIDQELLLYVYDMGGSVIAGARLFDPVDCPGFGPTVLGYDTDSFAGEGLLGHSGICDGLNATSLGWHLADTNYCACGAPDGNLRTCDDIYTANGDGSAILFVGGSSSSHAYEAVYSPGSKDSCDLDLVSEVHELQIGIYVADPDADDDGVLNFEDVCPEIFDPGQEDDDGDGLGDACDACLGDPGNDVDEDGVCALADNCPADANPMQENADADALGDLCDPCPGDVGNDPDADEICAAMDNCPEAFNPTQIDQDGDGIGAVCDVCPLDAENDGDGDGLCSDADNCPAIANAGQEDADMDDVGDECDACPDVDDMISDVDRDGICATDDNCPSVANPDQTDTDGDGDGDVCDPCPDDAENDIDADDVCYGVDNCPELSNPNQADEDGDGIGDACDTNEGTTSGPEDSGGPVDDTAASESEGGGSGPIPGSTGGPGSDDGTTSGGSGSDTGSEAGEDIVINGCGCTTTPSRGAWLSLFAVVFGLRRRRPARRFTSIASP